MFELIGAIHNIYWQYY